MLQISSGREGQDNEQEIRIGKTGIDIKKCCRCGKIKPLDDFQVDRTKKDGHRYDCRACFNSHRTVDREKARTRAKVWRNKNHERMLWNNCRHRARIKSLPFTIVVSDIYIPSTCPICDSYIERSEGMVSTTSPSVDMYDPRLGYTPDNTWVMCQACNRSKWNMSGEDHVVFGEKLIAAFKEHCDRLA